VRVATGAAAGLAVLDAVLAAGSSPRTRRARAVTKPALVPAIAIAVTAGGRELPPPLRAALAGSWAGDVALLSRSDAGFLSGVTGFAAAHLGYLTEIRRAAASVAAGTTGADGRVSPGGAAAALPACATAAVVAAGAAAGARLWRRLDRPGERRLRGPVLGYAALVTGMGAAAVRTGLRAGTPAGRRLAAGGALFVLSDGLVAWTHFGARRRAAVEAAVMGTYAAAQALLTDALSRPARPPASAARARPRPGAARCRWSPTGR